MVLHYRFREPGVVSSPQSWDSSRPETQSSSRKHATVDSATTPPAKKPAPVNQQVPKRTDSERANLLQSASSSVLFQFLFESGGLVKSGRLLKTDLVAIKKRFHERYTNELHGHHTLGSREVTNRLGILRALDQVTQQSSARDLRAPLSKFYVEILESSREPWAIKRQALRNLAYLDQDLTIEKKEARLQKLDPRLIATAALTDRELLEALVEN